MLFEDTYLTIEKASEGIFKDKGSKFLAYAYPVSSEEKIKELLLPAHDVWLDANEAKELGLCDLVRDMN